MGGGFNTAVSLVASVVDHSNRKKAIRRIDNINEQNRNVQSVGRIHADQLIPINYQMGNLCISGGGEIMRNELIVQNCKQSISVGMPTVIFHEGNYQLEQALQSAFSNHSYMRIINTSNSYYDPVFKLNDMEIGHFISEASLKDHKVDSTGVMYVKVLATMLRKQGITPYMRMFTNCPHSSINTIILKMEQSGVISASEADILRNEVSTGSKAQADVEYYFQQLELESPILAWKSNLSKCTSITDCIHRNGIMSIDVSSCSCKNQTAMLSTELEYCTRSGIPFRIIVEAVSIAENDKLISVLKNSSNSLVWTLVSQDINRMLGNAQGELSTWLSLSHRAVLFSHGIKTCEMLSAELGDYEHINVVETHAGNNNIGRIGYHYGANTSFSTSSERKRVIQPEEIESLGNDGFIMLDNYTAMVSKGILV